MVILTLTFLSKISPTSQNPQDNGNEKGKMTFWKKKTNLGLCTSTTMYFYVKSMVSLKKPLNLMESPFYFWLIATVLNFSLCCTVVQFKQVQFF